MSDMYKILRSLDSIVSKETVYKPLEEGNTKIRKIGNNVEVDDGQGNKTTYDQKTWDEMNKDDEDGKSIGMTEDMEDDIINDKYASDLDIDAPDEFALGDFSLDTDDDIYGDDIGMDFNFEAIDDDGIEDKYASDLDIDAPDEFSIGDFSLDTDDDIYGDDIGMDFSFEGNEEYVDGNDFDSEMSSGYPGDLDTDDFDEPEYSPFDVSEQGRRLRAGTPIVFDDSIGGGTGTFIEKSPSGFFGTAERNGKTINIHLSDIVAADLTNEAIYESFETKFNELMEGAMPTNLAVDPTVDAPPAEAAVDTVTIQAEVPVDQVAQILALSGLNGGQEEVYQQYGQEEVPTGQEMAQEPDMQSMLDTVSDDEPENEGYDPDSEEADYYRDEQQDRDDNHDDDEDPFGEKPRRDDDGYEIDEGIGDTIQKAKRGFNKAFWWDGLRSPEEVQNRVRQMSDEELESIAGQGIDDQQAGGSGTPRAFQVKAIDRELRRRGLRDFKKYGDSRKMRDSVEEEFANEPDEKIASADTQLNAMSGGLNKQKRQYKDEYPGDNHMTGKDGRLEESADVQWKDTTVFAADQNGGEREIDIEYATNQQGNIVKVDWPDQIESGIYYDEADIINQLKDIESNRFDESVNDVESFLNLYKVFKQH